jgi:tRNA threonylcarbamoyladenosine biosynthesis protein TsaE
MMGKDKNKKVKTNFFIQITSSVIIYMMMALFQNVDERSLKEIAKKFAKILFDGSVVLLEGDLGGGKTTFVRYLVGYLGGKGREVTSPTFTIVNEYEVRFKIHHIDLFRLNEMEVNELPIEDYLESNGICLIEWPDKLGAHVPANYFKIEFEFVDENHRNVRLSSTGSLYDQAFLRGDFSVKA